jgi:hypothetical protein
LATKELAVASQRTGELLTKNMTVVLHPAYSPDLAHCNFSVSRHFITVEMMEAESCEVLNTHTRHDFQAVIKNGRSAGFGAYAWKGTTSRVMVVSRSKVSF